MRDYLDFAGAQCDEVPLYLFDACVPWDPTAVQPSFPVVAVHVATFMCITHRAVAGLFAHSPILTCVCRKFAETAPEMLQDYAVPEMFKENMFDILGEQRGRSVLCVM
jgi:hypothetical protein